MRGIGRGLGNRTGNRNARGLEAGRNNGQRKQRGFQNRNGNPEFCRGRGLHRGLRRAGNHAEFSDAV